MFKDVNEAFDSIKDIYAKNNFSTDMIEKAFKFASIKHGGVLRKDGTPYISHPVEVALILAKLGFDEDVISAALLHDVVEDCEVTTDEITEMFNNHVSQMVDCVSAIDKTKYVLNHEDIFEDDQYKKASIEEQSFKKLISIGKKNPAGFCIKLADRLHNLRTIGCFNYNKQLEKVKETEKWILPIAKILNANYFYQEIKNECFKIINKGKCEEFLEQYASYHTKNQEYIEKLIENLNKFFLNKTIKSILWEDIKEYKIYENLTDLSKNLSINKITTGQILKVPNFNIYILHNDEEPKQLFKTVLSVFNTKFKGSIEVIDINIDDITEKTFITLQDGLKNKYNLYLYTVDEYSMLQTGVLTKQLSDIMDDEELDNLDNDLIRVRTRSGEIKYIQKGSTVLDFAFKLHNEIGFGFKYAIINDSKTQNPPYTKLYKDDKVEIVTETDEDGNIKNMANLKWFAYVNTNTSKKRLIKYFEKQFDIKEKKE